MDPQRTTPKLPPTQPLPPPRRLQTQPECSSPTAPSPISPLPHYPPQASNPISETAPSLPSPSQHSGDQGASISQNQRPIPRTASPVSQNQFLPRQSAPSYSSPNQTQNALSPLHQKSLPNPLSLPQLRTEVAHNPVPNTISPTTSLLGQHSPNQPFTNQPPGFWNRLSPGQYTSTQLPHPSQLLPNQWPTRSSFSDQGSPSSMSRSLSSNSSVNPAPHVNARTNPNPSPRSEPIVIARSISNPTRVPVHAPIPNFIHNPVPALALTFPNLETMPMPTIPQPVLPTPPIAGVDGVGGYNTSGNLHANMYVAQVERHFKGQPILFFEFLMLLKKLGAGEIEPDQFIQRMDGVLGGRADLLLGLGMFTPPQHRHLIFAKVEATATAHQNLASIGAGSSLEAYRSPTVDYLSSVQGAVDEETWKLLCIILKRYYSNLTDLLIHRESISQLEHILKDHPDLQKDCGMLL